MAYDLLIKNGHVIDPSQGLDGVFDVGISNGRIDAVGPELEAAGCPDIRDATGFYVCPGLVDLHGHWYEGGLYGIDPEHCLNHGVTSAVDAGTTGFANFNHFRRTVIDQTRVNLLGFIHISCLGLQAPFAEELLELRYARPEETAAIIDRNRDRAVGVKVRIGSMTGNHGLEALRMALDAADRARVPLMVHISKGAAEKEILGRLRPGDILTHCFHGRSNGMIKPDSRALIEQVHEARKRGVFFDVGHGCGSFSWDTAQKAFEHYFFPDTISTDLHRYCVDDPLYITLPEVMSKFLCLGMSLHDVVLKTTVGPAKALGRDDNLGTLRPGVSADLLQFEVLKGEFHFIDTHFQTRAGDRRLRPRLVVRKGVVYTPGQVPVRLRDLFECDRQVFQGVKAS